jgi:C4-dicarboxylate transporter
MKKRNSYDIWFALLFFPAEIYMIIRLGHFFRAWQKFFSNKKVDNWAAQAKAERGAGNAYLVPILVLVLAVVALMFGWFQLPTLTKSQILYVGWPVLAIITVLQTFNMATKLLKRHRGYKV